MGHSLFFNFINESTKKGIFQHEKKVLQNQGEGKINPPFAHLSNIIVKLTDQPLA